MILKRSAYRLAWAAALFAVVALLASCNAQKKNTAVARQYTAFITRYNIHYNGQTHLDETLEKMETAYEDDFSRTLYMHPTEARSDQKAPQPTGNFDRSIEKAQKAIQLRSIKKKPAKKSGKGNDPAYREWLKRDEYNPFIHNDWLMMGQGQYYNGDFAGAASTFFYISKHFTWLPATVTEAKLWEAQSYLALDWLYEAELIITRIKPEQLTNKELRFRYNFVYADFLIRSKEYEQAIPYLQAAIDGSSGAQKTRLRFLLGQLYAALGQNELAYQAFAKAGSSASAPYRVKFNARIKQSEVYTGANIEPEVKALRRMTRYDRNKPYLDQIYYAIGNLYLSRGDTLSAIDNYVLAAEKSTRNGIDKAISQVTLGGLYFDLHRYEDAQPCYAEAIPLLPDTYPNYKMLKRRSDVLDELAVYSQNVNLQDSLLHLASLPEDQQLAIIDGIIAELREQERKAEREAQREAMQAQQAAAGQPLQDDGQREYTINTDNSWYFYNTATRNAGKTEFQRRWGSRKNEDDWRRRNKASFNVSDFDSPTDDDEQADGAQEGEEGESEAAEEETTPAETDPAHDPSDPHNREYYLAQIPSTPEDVATAHEVIQEGLYNLGVILKDKLDDFSAARSEFDRLLTDYPDNIYRLDVYYNLYLMYMRMGDTAEAEKWRQLILSDFPESNYGMALQNPDYIESLRQMDAVQEQLYEAAYADYLENRNQEVHQAYETMMDMYPMSKIMPKFMFLHALAYVTEDKPEEFNAVLRDLLDRYPDTDITPTASAWLKGMAQGRQLHSPEENMRGMIWDIHLTNDSTAMANDSIMAAFTIDKEAPQLLVMVFDTEEVSGNTLIYEVARFNFSSFAVRDFDLEYMNFGRLGMLVVRGFENQRELDFYRARMAESPTFIMMPGVRPVEISVDNFEMLLRDGRTFDDYFRFIQEQQYLDAQRALLPPEEQETLDEAEQEPAADEETTDDEPDAEEPSQEPAAEPEQEPSQEPTAEPAQEPSQEPAAEPTQEPEAADARFFSA